MWDGPYGEWGSRKYLMASIDQSLKRLQLDYLDIFYSHRPDPHTPLEETIGALNDIVRQGKALYAGVSNYRGAFFVQATELAQRRGWAPLTIHQPNYNLFDRWIESDLLQYTQQYGTGVIVFSPLAQGMLSSKYLDRVNPIPQGTRASDPTSYLKPQQITEDKIERVRKLSEIAAARGQSMAQMAIAWVLRDERVTSALIGARNPQQIVDCVGALKNVRFDAEELAAIDAICPA
jgi:L-glyceraldehyde 3-phosphate reductase